MNKEIINILKETVEENPKALISARFLLYLAKENEELEKENEELKLLICECAPERWFREQNIEKIKKWIRKAEEIITK